LLQTLTAAYRAGVDWIAPTYLTGDGIGLYTTGLEERLEAADTFSMMADIFPTADSFDFLSETVEGDAVLYEFRLNGQEPGLDRHAMIAWCLDDEPWNPGSFTNPECSNATPQPVDWTPFVGGLTHGSITVHDYKGIVLSHVDCDGQPGCTAQSPCVDDITEAPVVITWISDYDCARTTATLGSISIQNSPLYLTSFSPAATLSVIGHYDNGIDCDVSAGALATTYQSQDPEAATVDADGLVVAQSVGSTVIDVANGVCTDEAVVVVESLPMQLTASQDRFEWPAYSGAVGYDIVRGDLMALRTTQGGFSTSTELCLWNDVATTTILEGHEPLPGEGWWYLMRVVYSSSGNTGSYDVNGTGTTRNAGIAASSQACP